jgi:hypothetical protein
MIHDKLTTKLRAAFLKQLKDACQSYELVRIVKVFDSRTDKLISVTEEKYPGYGAFLKITKEDKDFEDSLASNDLKIIQLQDDFPVEPKIGDIVNNLRVIAVGQDPTSTIWKIYLRGLNGME